jgi:diguanylate cyclase (GGDEF)-like protein/PAS domain S-box-containing protein
MENLTLQSIARREVICVDEHAPVAEGLARMEAACVSCLLSLDGQGKPAAIFTEQDAVRLVAEGCDIHRLDMGAVMSRPVLTAPGDMDFRDAYRLMTARQVRHLAMVDADGCLAGIVTETDFVQHVGLEYLVELKTVASVMTSNVLTLAEDGSLAEASRLMAEGRLSCVLVLRGQRPVGILTERDLVRLAREVGHPGQVRLAQVMRAPVRSVSPDTRVHEAARMMLEAGIRRLAVVREGRLVGILTRHDIAKALDGRYVELLLETVGRQQVELEDALAKLRDLTLLGAQHKQLQVQTQALSAAANAIVITDVEGRIQWANPAFSRLTGYSLQESLGHKPGELVSSGKQDRPFYEQLWNTILAGRPWHGEVINRRKDGSHYDEELTITPVCDGAGLPTHFIAVKSDITQRKAMERELTLLATTDSLTGLANRRHFLEQMSLALARFSRHGTPTGLLMIDIDHFKRINDQHGHAAGDAVLQHLASLLRSHLRQIDLPGRLGGEEFAVLLPDTGIEGACEFAERLRAELAGNPPCINGRRSVVTVSIGVTQFLAEDQDIDLVLARADRALYRAKRLSRDRVETEAA